MRPPAPAPGPATDAAGATSATSATGLWDIAVPSRPSAPMGRSGSVGPPGLRHVPGLTMAGFRSRVTDPVDLRVVPYPAVTLVVDLGEGLSVVDAAGGRRLRGSVVAGLAPDDVRALVRHVECLQLRLSPVAAHAVLGGAARVAGTVVGLDDLWGAEAARLEERLRAATSWDDRFALAAAAVARRLDRGRAVDPEVAVAWRRMLATRGQVRVDELADDVGWSRKRLWSRFRAQVGMTPKRAARLVRFDHAAHRLAAGHSPARVAAETGYADESHLHRDARGFAGLTPTAVARAPWLTVDDVAWGAGPAT